MIIKKMYVILEKTFITNFTCMLKQKFNGKAKSPHPNPVVMLRYCSVVNLHHPSSSLTWTGSSPSPAFLSVCFVYIHLRMCVLANIWGGGVAVSSIRLLNDTSWTVTAWVWINEDSTHPCKCHVVISASGSSHYFHDSGPMSSPL